MRVSSLAVALALLLPAPASAQTLPAGVAVGQTAKGKVLTDAKGMTLYVFDEDKSGVSSCYEKCVDNWPPLAAPAGAQPVGDFSVIKRKDGSGQWAYKGKPLYTWHKDKAPGDVSGDGVRDIWHLAKP